MLRQLRPVLETQWPLETEQVSIGIGDIEVLRIYDIGDVMSDAV